MSRTRTFVLRVNVSGEFMDSDRSMAVALARDILKDKATETLRGPRGGAYLPVGEVRDIRGGVDAADFQLNRWSFVGLIDARYVRPDKA